MLLAAALLVGVDLLRGARDPAPTRQVASTPAATGSPEATAGPPPSPPAQPSPGARDAPVYRMDGEFPSSGPGTWAYAKVRGKVLGLAGPIRRFRVAVEKNVAEEEMDEFTRLVDETLGDARSWTGGRQYRLRRVPSGSSYHFTIYLATGESAHRLCASGGMDIRLDGVSYTSCRLPGRVVINLNRWRLSVPDYLRDKIDLRAYRQYVINHEVGHELGRFHEGCPGTGRPAPVMQQQTYGLQGCTANAWPYVGGRRYTGPPVA
jgi:hypothetical protein